MTATVLTTSIDWTAIVVSIALYLLVAGPALAACLYAVWHRSPGANDRAVDDVAKFVELRERARTDLAATGSIDRFAERKTEARAHLWPNSTERARRRSAAREAKAEAQPPASRVARPAEPTGLMSPR